VPPPNPDPNVKYELVEMQELSDWLRDEFSGRWSDDGEQWTYAGRCPRCGHAVSKSLNVGGVFPFEERAEPRPMECNCGATHEGGEAAGGCGAYWGLALKRRAE
jgi:hypothetical protein